MDRSVESIFRAALEKRDPSERRGYLDGVCGDDLALRSKIDALLKAEAETNEMMLKTHLHDRTSGEMMAGQANRASPSESPGDHIGTYKLLQRIGEGGFGTVWMAQQREPVKRRVALKIIKLGMDTRQVIARFEAERQALAMMDHPNIAKVLDAGATETGRPYFAMELVRGVPIIEYCDTEKLDTRARLSLFVNVCHAIQHAHQKGIIHRDIKPSNVLVTLHDGVPVPKVIDFGIAKATNAELTNKTLFTEHRQMIGTPAYMSPEQAEMSGLDTDTRTDIYSLGVLLYELLTGTTPFPTEELMSKGYAEMLRIIREVEPHKPSTRLSTLGETATRTAQQRHVSDPKKLGMLLKGDLDWIVMKCLEKDRTRRYETANALAADVTRHLKGEPVLAAPPSTAYRLHKFIRRNRVQVAAGTTIAAALVLGVLGTTAGMIWALNEKDRADSATVQAVAAAEAEAEQRRLAQANFERLRDILQSADPERSPGGATVLQLLDAATEGLDDNPPENELAEAEIRGVLGNVYRRLGEYRKARDHLSKALSIRERRADRGDDADLAQALHDLAATLWWDGAYAEAERLYSRSLEMRRRLFPTDHSAIAESLTHLAACRLRLGKLDEAQRMYEEALSMRRRLYDGEHEAIAQALNNLAKCMLEADNFREAENLHRQAFEMIRRLRGDSYYGTASASENLGICLLRRSEAELVAVDEAAARRSAEEAREAFERSLEIRLENFPSGHHQIAASLNWLARAELQLGNLARAEDLAYQCIEEYRRTRRSDHPDMVLALDTLGMVLAARGRWEQSVTVLEDALRIAETVRPPAEIHVAELRGKLGLALAHTANADETEAKAEAMLLESLEEMTRLRGQGAVDTVLANRRLVEFYTARGDASSAAQYRSAAQLGP